MDALACLEESLVRAANAESEAEKVKSLAAELRRQLAAAQNRVADGKACVKELILNKRLPSGREQGRLAASLS